MSTRPRNALTFLQDKARDLKTTRCCARRQVVGIDVFHSHWNDAYSEAKKLFGIGPTFCAESHLRTEGHLDFLGDLPIREAPYKHGVPAHDTGQAA